MTERKQNISQKINDFVFTKDLKITKTKIMRTNVNLKKTEKIQNTSNFAEYSVKQQKLTAELIEPCIRAVSLTFGKRWRHAVVYMY